MARLIGYGGAVKIATAAVAGIKSWTLDYETAALDSSGFDGGQWDTFIPGTKSWRGSFEGFKDGAPLTVGTEIALELEESSTSNQEWTGQAIITAVHPAVAREGLVLYPYDFKGTGTLTPATA